MTEDTEKGGLVETPETAGFGCRRRETGEAGSFLGFVLSVHDGVGVSRTKHR
jgi:hypothetical protein